MQLETLRHCPLDCLDGLLVALVGLVGIDDHFHEVGIKDQRMDVGGVDSIQLLEAFTNGC